MNKQVEQIKAEIERLKSELVRGACAAGIAMETNCKEEAYNDVLAFIDSLPDEPTTEGLEKAQNKDRIEDDYRMLFHEAYKRGKREQKEEMMKDAIPAIVYFDFSDPGDVVCRRLSVNKTALSDALLKLDMNDAQNDGSDVKLIIVKKDEVR